MEGFGITRKLINHTKIILNNWAKIINSDSTNIASKIASGVTQDDTILNLLIILALINIMQRGNIPYP